jgi:hypothetical protein
MLFRKALVVAGLLSLASATILGIGYIVAFGFNIPIYKDDGLWVRLKPDDLHLSSSMRLALQGSPAAVPGKFSWHEIAPGFQIHAESGGRTGAIHRPEAAARVGLSQPYIDIDIFYIDIVA